MLAAAPEDSILTSYIAKWQTVTGSALQGKQFAWQTVDMGQAVCFAGQTVGDFIFPLEKTFNDFVKRKG